MSDLSGDQAERAARLRAGMVAELVAAGTVRDQRVLEALGRVAREAFVPRFWTAPSRSRAADQADVRQWQVDAGGDALDFVYDIDRALAIRRATDPEDPTVGRVTSSASAPRIVAAMLELADLAAGMRVLEIGTGTGYNAALLRELVGRGGSVVSMDIDADLVARAAERLAAGGYDDVVTVTGDAYAGQPERGAFDRVIATVGCADIAPAWLQQLAPGGFCLLPLLHGGAHPLIRITPSDSGATGVVIGRAAFVGIQGHQAGRSPWPYATQRQSPRELTWRALPADLAADLQPVPNRQQIGAQRMWDLAYLLALDDRRTAGLLSLAHDGSRASVDPATGRIGWAGTEGPALRDRMLALARQWVAMGRPSAGDFTSRFTPLGHTPPTAPATPATQRWIIDRIDYRQTVTVNGPG